MYDEKELEMLQRCLRTEIAKRSRQIARFRQRNCPGADVSAGIRVLEESLAEYKKLYGKITDEIKKNGGMKYE